MRFPVGLEADVGDQLELMVRPETVEIAEDGPVEARVEQRTYHGRYVRYVVTVGDRELIVDDRDGRDSLEPGATLRLRPPIHPHVLQA